MPDVVREEDRPWRAKWLLSQRLALPRPKGTAKKVTQQELADRLIAAGLPVRDRPHYNQLETGAAPMTDALMKRMAVYFGVEVPAPPPDPLSDQALILMALDRLTDAIKAQTDALVGRFEHLEAGLGANSQMLGQVTGEVKALRSLVEPQTDTPPTDQPQKPRRVPPASAGTK